MVIQMLSRLPVIDLLQGSEAIGRGRPQVAGIPGMLEVDRVVRRWEDGKDLRLKFLCPLRAKSEGI